MGALQNAVTLMADPVWRQWLTAAAAYQARVVWTEDEAVLYHAARLRLAKDVLVTPDMLTARLVTIISTDPEVATAGSTPEAVTEALCISKVADVWTPLALWTYADM